MDLRGLDAPFLLDSTFGMPEFHASDLDNFVVDFLKDELGETYEGEPRSIKDLLVPIYRTGCNFRQFGKISGRKFNPPTGVPEEEVRENIKYNSNLQHMPKVLPAYLVPHINLQDLLDSKNLLRFIYYRGRLPPRDFWRIDNTLTYTLRQTRMISGPFISKNMIKIVDKDADGKKINDAAFEVCREYRPSSLSSAGTALDYELSYYSGFVYGPSEAYVIMKSQLLTYLFLKTLCWTLLRRAGLDCEKIVSGDLEHGDEAQNLRDHREGITCQKLGPKPEWLDSAISDQYEPGPPGIDLKRFSPRLEEQMERAKEHIHKFFDDPEYFTDVILQERDHHWLNIPSKIDPQASEIDRYYDIQFRHSVHRDCLRSASRRAIFEAFLWYSTHEVLMEFVKTVLVEYPGSDQKPDIISSNSWPLPPKLILANHLDVPNKLLEMYMGLIVLVRYHAIFFINEFRVRAIHAGSKSFREEFRSPRNNFQKPHYDGKPPRLCRLHTPITEENDDKNLLLELIDNFIADEGASTHIGIRKVTQRLQVLMLDKDDETVWAYMTDLVADTIDKLHVLAELAEHLERWHPMAELLGNLSEEQRREHFRRTTEGKSIDFIQIDRFAIDEENCVPDKRMNRLYTLLDEMQRLETDDLRGIGFARGDLRRYGASLLKKLIIPTDLKSQYRAGKQALKRLEVSMSINQEQYPFLEGEEPINLGAGKLTMQGPNGTRIPRETLNRKKYEDQASKWRRRSLVEGAIDVEMQDGDDDEVEERDVKGKGKATEMTNSQRKNKRKKDSRRNKREGLKPTDEDIQTKRQTPDSEQTTSEDQRAIIVERRAAKMRARLRRRHLFTHEQGQQRRKNSKNSDDPKRIANGTDKMDVEHDSSDAQAGPSTAPVGTQTQPLSQLQPQPALPLAPDRSPKRPLGKKVWNTFENLFDRTEAPKVTWDDLVKALGAVGYVKSGLGSGSHQSFTMSSCRFPPERLPKGKNLVFSEPHGSRRKPATKEKLGVWRSICVMQGFTWYFLKDWYCR